MDLVEITPESHGVELALAYASADNLTGAPVYRRARCYLHRDAAAALARAVGMAAIQGFKLRIFDAFRPTEAQWRLWNHNPDPVFFADPRRGSPHSRGVAVDLTLVEQSTGRALDMGTGFDALTTLSYHGSTEVSPTVQRSRLMLLGLMTAAGWDFYSKEWWHYQLFDARRYPLWSDTALPDGLM
ncbi:MAG: D-alanyl-D-alanine dipeptidase [Alphaproteobacteria bacterium]|nr:D-alanyl-D-alanine dipeptidase [Alphaproteobacteria bacterium]